MPDTGAPWNLRYPDVTDLVVDGPAQFENLADDVAAGLSAAGGLVAVKTVTKTDVFSASVAAGAFADVTDLSITHEVSDPANKVMLTAHIGILAAPLSIANTVVFAVDGSRQPIGDADGSRQRSFAGKQGAAVTDIGVIGDSYSIGAVLVPGAGSKVYTVQVSQTDNITRTVYVNRSTEDPNSTRGVRGVSTFTLMEVRV